MQATTLPSPDAPSLPALPGWQERMRDTRLAERWPKLEARGLVEEFGLEREPNPEQTAPWRSRLAASVSRGALAALALAVLATGAVFHWQLSSGPQLGFVVLCSISILLRARRYRAVSGYRLPVSRFDGWLVANFLVLVGIKSAAELHSWTLALATIAVLCVCIVWIRNNHRLASVVAYAEFDLPPEKFRPSLLEVLTLALLMLGLLASLLAPGMLADRFAPPRPMLIRALALSGATETQVDAFLGDFRQAWNAGDLEALEALGEDRPDASFSTVNWKLERMDPTRSTEAGGLPQLSEVPLVGDWFSVPEVRGVEIQIELDGVEFRADLIAGPEGVVWR